MQGLICHGDFSNTCALPYSIDAVNLLCQENGSIIEGSRLKINESTHEIEIISKSTGYVLGELLASIFSATSEIFETIRVSAVNAASRYWPKEIDPSHQGFEEKKRLQEVTIVEPKSNVDSFAIIIKAPLIEAFKVNCDINLEKVKKHLDHQSTCEALSPYVSNRLERGYLPRNKGLESNLQLANRILASTREKVLFSSNNVARSLPIIQKMAEKHATVELNFSQIATELHRCKKKAVDKAWGRLYEKGSTSFSRRNWILQITKDTFIGNCADMSLVSLFEGMEMGIWNTQLDMVSIEPGDHVFLAIGRESGSDLEDYKTWGPSVVIVDTWKGDLFKLSDVETNLSDYVGMNKTTGEPLLRPFDPETQKLIVTDSNIWLPSDLIKVKPIGMADKYSQLYDEVVLQLKPFHQTQGLSAKFAQANTIYEFCSPIRGLEVIQSLMDQLSHFMEWCLSENLNEGPSLDYCHFS